MLGYNLFLFASLRERSYLYLALFITNFGLNDAFREGLAQQYLWPAWADMATSGASTSQSKVVGEKASWRTILVHGLPILVRRWRGADRAFRRD